MLIVVCSHCQSRNRVPDNLAGKKGKCPKCGVVLTIPPADDAAPSVNAASGTEEAALAAQVAVSSATERDVEGREAEPAEQATVASTPPSAGAGDTPPPDTIAGEKLPAADFAFLAPAQQPGELGRLGPYRVLQVLGQGGMGVVFVAEDPRLRRQIALKAMLPEMANKPTARDRFLHEAHTAATIEHDNIVTIYHVDEDRGVPFIAMPLLKGCSLEDWLRRQPEKPLPVTLILKLGREIASGLAAAHAHGLIHRDIKPANIFLQSLVRSPSSVVKDQPPSAALSLTTDHGPSTPDHRVKILDFGLARLTAGEQHLTQSGVIMGTPAYMAPEQARTGDTVDGRADLFSLGVVLYRLSTGTLPFKGEDMMTTLMSLAMDTPTPPRTLNAELPSALSALVMQLLEKDPANRPQTADEVVTRLKEIEAAEEPVLVPVVSTSVTPDAPPRTPRRDEIEAERARRRARYAPDEFDDDLEPLPDLKREQTAMSQASLIVGIASIVVSVFGLCCCSAIGTPLATVGGVAAIGLGYAALKQGGGRVNAQTGIACGSAALLLVVVQVGLMLLGLGINLLGGVFQGRGFG
jgi:serine/threonine protein kinase